MRFCVCFFSCREFFDIANDSNRAPVAATLPVCIRNVSNHVKHKTMNKDHRIRINKVMAGWSNGEEIHLPPSVRREVESYGRSECEYNRRLEEGREVYWGPCTYARNVIRCREAEADHYWELGDHLEALREMMWAARGALPDDEPGTEDIQWLDPEETFYWNPNVREFLRLARRCRDYCRRDPRLHVVYDGSRVDRDHRGYLAALGRWVHA